MFNLKSSKKSSKKKQSHYKQNSGNNKHKLLKKILTFSVKWSFILFLWFGTAISVFILYNIHDLPDVNSLNTLKKQRKITILASDNLILTNYGDLYNKYVQYKEIPKVMIEAVLATEDRRFFNHFGVDLVAIVRAAYRNYKVGYSAQGGSSITQQLAKIAFLSPDKTIKRKIQELVLSLYLEHKFTKEQILTMYLNRVYLGSGIYGIDAGARYYFGKELKSINLYEAAIIAGLLKAPSKFAPTNNASLSGQRAYQVLLNMKDAGYINQDQIDRINDTKVILKTTDLGWNNSLYFCDYVLDTALDLVSDHESDLVIKTTLDPKLQIKSEHIIKNYLSLHGDKLNIKQAGLVALAKDGSILAMVGGKDYKESPFNRAVQSKRQAGSAFKLFVYLNAIERGNYHANSIVNDVPIRIGKWQPKNYSRSHLGEITLKESFAKSINTVAVRLSESQGKNNLIKLAKSLGINSDMKPLPSIALGVSEVSLLDITSSFATINNNGYKISPKSVIEIKTTAGKILYRNNHNQQKKIFSTRTIEIMKELLKEVVENGTGKSAQIAGENVYGKTGTTQDYKDAWFIGFNNQITCGVWLGNDHNQPMNKVTGGGAPAIIWQEFMSR